MSGSKDILIANLRAEIAAGRGTEEANADERRVVAQLLDELLPKRIAEAESCGYDNGYRDGLRACDVDALRERAEQDASYHRGWIDCLRAVAIGAETRAAHLPRPKLDAEALALFSVADEAARNARRMGG